MVILLVAVLGVVVIFGALLAAMLLPAISAAREAARRAQCSNNLRQIGLAMHGYNAEYGCFPPAFIADEDGKPMHSWRVLLLPYLEQQVLYDQYDFDQPWDSPHNMALAALMPPIYRCPSASGGNPLATSYMMIVGPGTISDGPKSTGEEEIKDGLSNTIMLVEVTQSGTNWPATNWMKPRDLDAEKISYEINDGTASGIGSEHPGVANVLLCDGSVHSMGDWTDAELIKGMTTIAGDEDVSEFGADFCAGTR